MYLIVWQRIRRVRTFVSVYVCGCVRAYVA